MTRAVIVDCLGRVRGKRLSTVDVIGAGPRSVAGILEKHKVYVYIKPIEEFLRLKEKIRTYDILMLSAMSTDKLAVMKAIKYWRNYGKGPIILGGPIVFGYHNLSDLEFNIAVYGEAEKTLDELLELGLKDAEIPPLKELINVKGIVFNHNGKLIFTGRRDLLKRRELEQYKPSTRTIIGYEQYWAYRIYVEVVRGCSNFRRPLIVAEEKGGCKKCSTCFTGPMAQRLTCPLNILPGCGFCSVPALYGPPRSRGPRFIIEEVKELVKYGVTRIVLSASDILDYGRDVLVEPDPLTDPRCPPPNIEWLRKLFDEIFNIDEISKGEVQVLLENTKASLVNETTAKLLGEYFKGSPIHVGCETGSTKHALLIGRPVTPREVVEAVKLLRKYGLKPYVYFIHGLPGQNRETVKKTLEVMDYLRRYVEKITIYRFTPIPGTAFEKYPVPPPARVDKLSKAIVNKARKINMEFKKQLIGKTVVAIVVNPYAKNTIYNIAYTLPHGPVILVKNARRYYGFKVLVKINDIITDRLVLGELVKVLSNVRLRALKRK